MILKNLTLINFRKFKNTTIEFPDGVTGVTGLNGTGKSTIFEAISWVLYGPVAARTSTDEIKRQNAETKEPCRVELEFIFENENYRVIREITGKSLTASATATINGKIAATSAETVSKYIQKKLGMDFKSFFTSIFAKQKELNTLSSMNASERRPLILKMLGIDSLDKVIKEIKTDKKQKDNLLEKLQTELIDENGEQKIEIYKNETKTLEKEKKQNEKIIKEKNEKIKTLDKKIKEIQKQCENTKKEYEKLQENKEKLIEEKTKSEKKEKILEEIVRLKNKIKQRNDKIQTKKQKLEIFLKIDQELKKLDKRQKILDETLKKYLKEIEQKNTLITRIQQDIKEINTKKDKIIKIGPKAECPTCERILADQYKNLLTKFSDEISKNDIQIEKHNKKIKILKIEQEKHEREKNALDKKHNYLQKQLKEKERIETTIKNLKEEINHEKDELKEKEKIFNDLKEIKFSEEKYKKIINQVDKTYQKYQKILKQRDEKKDDYNSLKIELEKIESNKKLISQKIKTLDEKIEDYKKAKNKINQEKAITQQLGMLSEVMINFRTYLISRIRPTLSDYSSDFFERLTDGKYHRLELDDNYNLLIYDNGQAYGVERFSGGEEDLANLCLRLAISEIITEKAGGVFNFIILDEIFGSQDYIRRQNIMKALNLLSSKFRQIFLITHVDDVKNDMENIINVTEDEYGYSKVKVE